MSPIEVANIGADLRTARLQVRSDRAGEGWGRTFPSRRALEQAVADLSAALYPRRLGDYTGSAEAEDHFVIARLEAGLSSLQQQVGLELDYWRAEAKADFDNDQAATILSLFARQLSEIRRLVDTDLEAAFLGDPAARSIDEILICYPGATAILHHRIAHALFELGAVITARLISELANTRTGIDIHPGATIGHSFFIDHGTGVVIGETAIIGDRVRLYQHVTLGARSPLGASQLSVRDRHARHPIVGDDVIIYAGATILGRVTIGRGSTIGGNVWLLADVPPDTVVTQPEAVLNDVPTGMAVRDALERRVS